LSEAQAEAAAALRAKVAAREFGVTLLAGVTGSGKTEVYLAAVEAALERGKGAIVLVPEIGLAPQAVARFRARLGDRFAVLHSALSPGERYDEWRRLRSGEASVCVGPRSAVFAPVHELGLIVIDEEHEPSYKQEGDPTYDARTVARKRAADSGAVLVAGTATPRPESWLELPRLELPRRVDGRRMPPVHLVDMRWRGCAPPAPRRS
jgi:primosomal protein N' (replication factor Y)